MISALYRGHLRFSCPYGKNAATLRLMAEKNKHDFHGGGGCLSMLFGWAKKSIEFIPSVKTLGTLAKILHILTYSCLLLKLLIRSCLFLLHKPLEFLDSILGKSLIKSVKRMKQTVILFTNISLLFALPATQLFYEVLNIGQH